MTSEIIRWLESPDGQKWSEYTHARPHMSSILVSVKDDMDVDISMLPLWLA